MLYLFRDFRFFRAFSDPPPFLFFFFHLCSEQIGTLLDPQRARVREREREREERERQRETERERERDSVSLIFSVLINECPFLASQYHLNSHQTHLLSWCLFLLRLHNSSSFSPSFSLYILFLSVFCFPSFSFPPLPDSPANLLPKSFLLQVVLHTIPSLHRPIQITRIFAKFLRLSFEDQPNLGAVNWRGDVIYVLTVRHILKKKRLILSEWKIGSRLGHWEDRAWICQFFFFFYFFRAMCIPGACPRRGLGVIVWTQETDR